MILSIILYKLRKSNIKFIKFKSCKIVYFVQTFSKSSKILKKWILESYRIMHFSLKELGYSYEEINEITSKNNRFKLNQYYTL